ncbi:RDD family protein [Phycicoccus avicenniae]|uniref:RDD family protein n=1 Tax=Phycicoccus avicenniae TaxID=2828860 RepID=UPI003D2C6E58
MTTPTAAGWYDDPEDAAQLRYFDGIVWTAHTTTKVSPTAAASTIGRSPEVRPAAERSQTEHGWTTSPGAGGPGTDWSSAPAGGAYASYGAPTGKRLPDGAVLAEWWRRFLGRLVDSVLTGVLTGLLALPFLGDFVDTFRDYVQQSLDAAAAGSATPPSDAALQAAVGDILLPVTLLSLAVALVYEVGFLLWRSATPGKMLLGTVVRRAAAAGPVTFTVAARRQVIKVVTTVLGLNALLGFLGLFLQLLDPAWLLWDPRRQTLHDKVADTVVVRRR